IHGRFSQIVIFNQCFSVRRILISKFVWIYGRSFVMRRSVLMFGVLVLAAALGIFIPAASAQCSPDGTIGGDTIVCDGDDVDGVNTGTGADTVTIVSGTVLDTIIAEGSQISVIVNGAGALDTTA